MVSVFVEAGEGVTPSEVAAWYRQQFLPSALPDSDVASVLAFSPLPLLADAPGDVPRDAAAEQRLLLLFFLDNEPTRSWDKTFAAQEAALSQSGLGRVVWASPFIGTVPGTDTYTDQLWSTPAP
jgi:hypothetical protein